MVREKKSQKYGGVSESGLWWQIWNLLCVLAHRGFESHPLRHF